MVGAILLGQPYVVAHFEKKNDVNEVYNYSW